jgi:hypothetical protein
MECEALVDFYYSTNGDAWTTGTQASATNPRLMGSQACNWYGITCNTNPKYITTIRLVDNNLKGVLNPSLSVLTGLRDFRVYNNQLTGTLPVEYSTWSDLIYFLVYNNTLN